MRSIARTLITCLACAMMSVGLLAGCTDSEQANEPAGPPISADGGSELSEEDGSPTVTPEPEVPAPTFALADVAPGSGSSAGGDGVNLVGVGFETGMRVFFGAMEAAPPFVSSSTVAGVTTPAGAEGHVDVRVLHPDGREWTLRDGFYYYNPFGVVSVLPEFGPLEGGVQVEIEGFGFDDSATFLVGHRVLISPEILSPTRARGYLPPGVVPGAVDVAIVKTAGRRALEDGFVYGEALRISHMEPYAGPSAGGQTVKMRGGGFSEDMLVRIGGVAASLVAVGKDGRWADVTSPPGPVGAASVVATKGGESFELEKGYFYVDGPLLDGDTKIHAVWPSTGPSEGGKLISIVAGGLTAFGDIQVRFGGVTANVAAFSAATGLLTVVLPPNPAGAVDVSVSTANGTHTLPSGFVYFDAPAISVVKPAEGPADGGTALVIEGLSLSGATSVRVGALFAPSFVVKNDSRIEAVAPPGSPGWADVVVETPVGKAVAPAAYTYKAGAMKVLALEPDVGALSGGLAVRIIGTDLPAHVRVSFGNIELLAPQVEGPTTILVTSPPWTFPASVDVTVQDKNSPSTDTLENGFTYFNPAATQGGTWGPPVGGTLNVSVLDMWSQQGIDQAYVILWTEANTPYQGLTDPFGNITFNGADLDGAQMATAWASGYSASSIVEFDAENVTILLFPFSPPSSGGGGGSGGNDVSKIRGKALISDKYLIPPVGSCASGFTAPVLGEWTLPKDYLCATCKGPEDCGPEEFGNSCTPMVGGQSFCTTSCDTGLDCPSGYSCLTVQVPGPKRCMPVSGTVKVTCRLTSASPFNAPPGGFVDADLFTGDFEITTVAGKYGVVCQSETWDLVTNTTSIIAMGAAGPVVIGSGDLVDGIEVPIDVPFKREVKFTLDYPPSRLTQLPNHRVRALLALGDFGFHEVVRVAVDPDVGSVTLPRMPEGLTGSLSSARWYVLGGAYSAESSFEQWIPPYATAILRELPGLGETHLYQFGSSGTLAPAPTKLKALADVFGFSSSYVVAVGEGGAMYRFNGSAWSFMGSPVNADWRAVWGASANDMWAVGDGGRVARWTGAVWTLIDTLDFEPRDVAGTSSSNVLIVGDEGRAAWWDGSSFVPVDTGTALHLRGAWGDSVSDTIWVVGDASTVLRFQGGSFEAVPVPGGVSLHAVAGVPGGTSGNSVVVAGEFGTLRRFDGGVWPKIETGDARTILGLWVGSNGSITAVGERGLVLDVAPSGIVVPKGIPGSGARLTGVWGAGATASFAVGQDSALIGPLYEIPTFNPPLDQGLILDYAFSWSAPGGPVPDFNYVVIGAPWWRPVWQVVTAGHVTDVQLPNLKQLMNWNQLQGLNVNLEIMRGNIPGFDINNFEYIQMYFREQMWGAWSIARTVFNAP